MDPRRRPARRRWSEKPYAAIWVFQPLGTGTAILVSCVLTALFVRLPPGEFIACIGKTIRQAWLAVVTVMLIVALACLMNYSGLAYTMGKAVASTGQLFILTLVLSFLVVLQQYVFPSIIPVIGG